ncbi:hypothetical protein PENSTE_c013G02765 [Penicillium steckii]|uniref:RGS domain-containing protein n=1 Tax=Penicillium steckii TaxID=303698 RepID=A0A1V6T480_9EURO|nr:hypothetical protein PENSTE_c013G02765 [Penicillium steckii]
MNRDRDFASRQMPPGRNPDFDQIIAGNTETPFALESFVEYLSENHCIELLDFLSDTKNYIDAYRASAPDLCLTRMTSDSRRLGKQWKILMSTYIMPGSPDELNVPEFIRVRLLDHVNVMISPPNPTALDPAISYAHHLLTDSALLPFIQSIRSSGNYRMRNHRNGQNGQDGRSDHNNHGSCGSSLSPMLETHSSSQGNFHPASGASVNQENRDLFTEKNRWHDIAQSLISENVTLSRRSASKQSRSSGPRSSAISDGILVTGATSITDEVTLSMSSMEVNNKLRTGRCKGGTLLTVKILIFWVIDLARAK